MKVEFKVAMDAEQAKAKNHVNVVLEVGKADDATMLKYALKAYVVELQAQCRANWGEFIKGDYPKELKIGEAMFASTRGKVSAEKAKEMYKDGMASLTPVQKLRKLLDDGMITDDIYQASVESLYDKGMLTDKEMEEAMEL